MVEQKPTLEQARFIKDLRGFCMCVCVLFFFYVYMYVIMIIIIHFGELLNLTSIIQKDLQQNHPC